MKAAQTLTRQKGKGRPHTESRWNRLQRRIFCHRRYEDVHTETTNFPLGMMQAEAAVSSQEWRLQAENELSSMLCRFLQRALCLVSLLSADLRMLVLGFSLF
jgi:hypothetical protein